MTGESMTCPDCGSLVLVDDGVIAYHTRPDNLAACTAAGSSVEKPEKPARKPRPKK